MTLCDDLLFKIGFFFLLGNILSPSQSLLIRDKLLHKLPGGWSVQILEWKIALWEIQWNLTWNILLRPSPSVFLFIYGFNGMKIEIMQFLCPGVAVIKPETNCRQCKHQRWVSPLVSCRQYFRLCGGQQRCSDTAKCARSLCPPFYRNDLSSHCGRCVPCPKSSTHPPGRACAVAGSYYFGKLWQWAACIALIDWPCQ